MNPNDNKNNKNNKPGGNWRGVASLVGWALLLTIIFSYASSVIGSTGRQASSINVEYGDVPGDGGERPGGAGGVRQRGGYPPDHP